MRLSKLTAATAGTAAIAAAFLVQALPGDGPLPHATDAVVLMSGTPTAPAPGTVAARGAAAARWQSTTQSALKRLNIALADFQTAMDAQNFPNMRDACGRVGSVGHSIQKTLPAPVDGVTAPMSSAAASFIEAGTHCDALNPDGDRGALNTVVSAIQSGMGDIRTAQAALAAASPKN
ncbi:tannase and feruloyl esterase, precursor [Mycolicibacterium canariasense]|uniref:Tannase and feruloyl esterase n=1 Tax=Mycolicibacterium canariasense TaxID=228230 RepID=A0A100WBU5_MYCCR|nr:hypothetical protein [Mycolicibacterium canariasense]MCV7209324.1 hypothetical protein [Mycolicibacterium canariasense]ORV05850.1 hypothetical protein AWB94_18190 [Mycolicibacterium canariasense]GAS95143.1 tannase and feruloyl esterase, precursor [Mycolicibacterium canariasense]